MDLTVGTGSAPDPQQELEPIVCDAVLQRSLWAYWHQGEAQAPYLVRHCLDSWRRLHPGWTLTVLDRESLQAWPELEAIRARPDVGLQAFTDILRVWLLHRYGGAWIDATLYCTQALDEWLPAHVDDDFFAFASRRRDRCMQMWFLYATPRSRTLAAWKEAIDSYWARHRFRTDGRFSRFVLRKLMSLRRRELVSNDFWFTPFVAQGLRVYPYPVNMYLFEKMLSAAPALAGHWQQRAHRYDEPAERLQNHFGMNAAASEASLRFLRSAETPMHKLNWRQDRGHALPDSNLQALLSVGLSDAALPSLAVEAEVQA